MSIYTLIIGNHSLQSENAFEIGNRLVKENFDDLMKYDSIGILVYKNNTLLSKFTIAPKEISSTAHSLIQIFQLLGLSQRSEATVKEYEKRAQDLFGNLEKLA